MSRRSPPPGRRSPAPGGRTGELGHMLKTSRHQHAANVPDGLERRTLPLLPRSGGAGACLTHAQRRATKCERPAFADAVRGPHPADEGVISGA